MIPFIMYVNFFGIHIEWKFSLVIDTAVWKL